MNRQFLTIIKQNGIFFKIQVSDTKDNINLSLGIKHDMSFYYAKQALYAYGRIKKLEHK